MGKITRNEMAPVLTAELDAAASSISGTGAKLTAALNKSAAQDREIAYLKLKQEAADRIEGGTTFATDFSGNEFGITFDKLASENVVIRNGGLTMNKGATVEHVVDDSVVLSSTGYTTQGNGGRKLVRLDNGWIVVAIWNTSTLTLTFQISKDDGQTWEQLCYRSLSASFKDVSLVSLGTTVYALLLATGEASLFTIDVLTQQNQSVNPTSIILGLTASGTCSLAINEEGTELHACWASKNSTYPNSYNIQYCKGVIGEGGNVAWGSVEQITSMNVSTVTYTTPTIVTNSLGRPVILYSDSNGSSKGILARVYDGTTWKQISVFGISTYIQQYPSAIFVPKSVNGLENGRIWVTWHGLDSTDTTVNNTRVSYSDDGGQTWSTMEKLTSGNTNYSQYPSITANKNNEIFIVFHGQNQGSGKPNAIKMIKHDGTNWGTISEIKDDTTNSNHINTLVSFDVSMTSPLFVYTDVTSSKIGFYGAWQIDSYTPTTIATAVYNLPSTDYVGLFVQKAGDITITATVNDTPMESELVGDEYRFTKALPTDAPVTLKLSLSRSATTNGDGDKITRILGGIA